MIFGRILLDTADFRLAAGLLGGLEVMDKNAGRSVKAVSFEKRYFHAVSAELERLGVAIAPGSKPFEEACNDFCEAILSRGGARWRAYIGYPPSAHAADLAPREAQKP